MSSKLSIPRLEAAIFFMAAVLSAAGQLATNPLFIARAQTALNLAQKNYLADTNSTAAACALARASFDMADLATNDAQRAAFARRGIDVCHLWLAHEPKSAPGHYYLAMNLGKLAQAEAPSLAAYKRVHEVESEFKTATELDVRYDYAGPARNLGELYFQAPGWPLSVGSQRKAREWLERAAVLAPEYPENQLNLAEAQLKWSEPKMFAVTMKNLEARWPAARTNFTGAVWEPSWQDWNARHTALQTEAKKLHNPAP
jgi:hypothetical protein